MRERDTADRWQAGSSPARRPQMATQTDAQPSDEAVRPDDGPTWLSLTRRQTLGAIGGAVLAGLGYASAQGQQPVGGDTIIAGGDYEVPKRALACQGTLRELYVVVHLEDAPEIEATPAVIVSLLEGTRIDPGTGSVASTETIQTNLAAVHVAQSLSDVSVTDTPALVMTVEDGDRLVVDGEPHQRSGLGSVERLWGGPTLSDVPASSSEPAAAFTQTDGNRVFV